MPPVQRDDPYPAHNFQVIVNGISDDGSAVSGAFSEAKGLDVEVKVIDYRNGNEGLTVRKLPGLTVFPTLVFMHGSTGDVGFWNWIKSAIDGNVVRAEGAIVLCDENQAPVMRWEFARGWPCKYSGPSFNAANNEIAMESIEICVERLTLDA